MTDTIVRCVTKRTDSSHYVIIPINDDGWVGHAAYQYDEGPMVSVSAPLGHTEEERSEAYRRCFAAMYALFPRTTTE